MPRARAQKSTTPAPPTARAEPAPPARRQVAIDALERAIWDAYGVVTRAAELAGIPRDGLNRRVRKSARLQAAVKAGRERLIDKAETGLVAAIDKREPWAITLALKTLGKSRGYVERQELAALFAMLEKDPSDMTDDELDQALASVTARHRG
jgi:hypothetical protein